MKKFQVIVKFSMDDDFAALIPSHRTFISYLINKQVIDTYCVSMESYTVWITVNAETKTEVEDYLKQSPLIKYWTYTIEELFVYDGQIFRLPAVQLN